MKRAGSFIADWWRLVIPYFRSEEWPLALLLLIGAIALTFVMVGFDKAFNDWNRRFYDAIQNKNEQVFWSEIIFYSEIAGRLHRAACRAWRRQPLSPVALAALADPALPRALVRRSWLLPGRAAALGRQLPTSALPRT